MHTYNTYKNNAYKKTSCKDYIVQILQMLQYSTYNAKQLKTMQDRASKRQYDYHSINYENMRTICKGKNV